MLLSLDFGITITDILKKTENGNIEHKMLPSDQKPSINFIKEVFKDLFTGSNGFDGLFLIFFHELAVTNNIGGKDYSNFSVNFFWVHNGIYIKSIICITEILYGNIPKYIGKLEGNLRAPSGRLETICGIQGFWTLFLFDDDRRLGTVVIVGF